MSSIVHVYMYTTMCITCTCSNKLYGVHTFGFFPRWGDCLVLVASQELRNRSLLGPDSDPHVIVFDVPYCILEHLGQARYKGRLQSLLSTKYLELDAKCTFHYLKGLVSLGVITRQVRLMNPPSPPLL